jgi:hypothetical protein
MGRWRVRRLASYRCGINPAEQATMRETSRFKLIGFGVMVALGLILLGIGGPGALLGIVVLIASPWLLFEAGVLGLKENRARKQEEAAEAARRQRVQQVMNQTPYGPPAAPEPEPFSPYVQPRPAVRRMVQAPEPVGRMAGQPAPQLSAASPAASLQWVGQGHDSGCVAACVAMLLGVDYPRAAKLLMTERVIEPEQLLAWGMSFDAVMPVLKAAGWVRNDHNPDVWLVDVWGGVDDRTGNPDMRHAVLLLPDNLVLDPATPEPRHIRGYRDVGDAIGLTRRR